MPVRPLGDRAAANGRWTPDGEDSAPCGIFHVPAEIDEAKTLASVQLPPGTDAGGNTVAYLMALTLEQADGTFELPDLSGRVPCADEDVVPVTAHRFSPAAPNGNDGWYAGTVQVTLDATDEGGSGVEQVSYRLDGGAVRPYGGSFALDADGAHTLEYRSIDCAGNVEDFKAVDLKVDARAPATTARLNPARPLGPEGWYDGAVAVALSVRDGQGSGPGATEYRLDGGAWTAVRGRAGGRDGGAAHARVPLDGRRRQRRGGPLRAHGRRRHRAGDPRAGQRRGAPRGLHRRRARRAAARATATARARSPRSTGSTAAPGPRTPARSTS